MSRTSKFAIAICTVFITLFSFGQYESIFGETSTYWKSYGKSLDYSYNDSLVHTRDIIIDGVQGSLLTQYITGGTPSQIFTDVFIEEDTISGKAWVYHYDGLIDSMYRNLVYDMSLILGDTLKNFPSDINHFIVDSVYFKNNRKHVRCENYIQLFNPDIEIQFEMIEGVGSNEGILIDDGHKGTHAKFLLCQHKDDTISYQQNEPLFVGDCGGSFVSIDENEIGEFELYPNPSHDYIYIIFNENIKGRIAILSIQGQLILEEPINSNEIKIDLRKANLTNGIYLVQVQSNENTLIKKLNYTGY